MYTARTPIFKCRAVEKPRDFILTKVKLPEYSTDKGSTKVIVYNIKGKGQNE